jgi:hypothetical protein
MSLISLSPHDLSSRRPLPGTQHRGPEWKAAVGLLRAALQNAVVHAERGRWHSADDVACRVIDHVRELDAAGLRVLLAVIGILVRCSRRDGS